MGWAIEDGKKVWIEPTESWRKVREDQGITLPEKPKDVESSGSSSNNQYTPDPNIYDPNHVESSGSSSSSKKIDRKEIDYSDNSVKNSSSNKQYTPDPNIYDPNHVKTRRNARISDNNRVEQEKDDLAGFKRRIERISVAEKKRDERITKAQDRVGKFTGLTGEGWGSTFLRSALALPQTIPGGAIDNFRIIGMKIAATAEGLGRSDTRSNVVKELGGAAKKTPVAVRDQYITVEKNSEGKYSFSFTPQQVLNIGVTAATVRVMGKMRSNQRANTVKSNSQSVTSTKVFKTPKNRRIVTIEKGRFTNLKGQEFTYTTKSSVSPTTGKGSYTTVVKGSAGSKLVGTTKGQINPVASYKSVNYPGSKVPQDYYYKTKFTSNKGRTSTTEQFGTRQILDIKKFPDKTLSLEKTTSKQLISRGKASNVQTVSKVVSTDRMSHFTSRSSLSPLSKLKFKFSDTRLRSIANSLNSQKHSSSGAINLKFTGKKGSLSTGRGGLSQFDPSSRFDVSSRFSGGFGSAKVNVNSAPVPSPTPPSPVSFHSLNPVPVPTPSLLGASPVPVTPSFVLLSSTPKVNTKHDFVVNDRSGVSKFVKSGELPDNIFKPSVYDDTNPVVDPVPVPSPGVSFITSVGSSSRTSSPSLDPVHISSPTPTPVSSSVSVPNSGVLPIIKRTGAGGSVFSGLFGGRTKVQRKGKYAPSLRASSFNIKTREPVKGSFSGLTERPIMTRSKTKY